MEIAASSRERVRTNVAGDFSERFEQLRRRLTAVCGALVGFDDARDLVHETYLRASQRLHQLRDPSLFDAWVVRIALNEAKAVLRNRRVHVARHPNAGQQMGQLRDIGLRELVEQLPLRERAVIVLHYAYGYRMGEIARLLDLSEIGVRTLAFRARRRLRAQLQEVS